MGWNVNDLTARTLGPLATFQVSGYVFAMDASQHVVFQGFSAAAGGDGHVHELFWHPGGWHLNDLTNAAGGAPLVTLFPTGTTSRTTAASTSSTKASFPAKAMTDISTSCIGTATTAGSTTT